MVTTKKIPIEVAQRKMRRESKHIPTKKKFFFQQNKGRQQVRKRGTEQLQDIQKTMKWQ